KKTLIIFLSLFLLASCGSGQTPTAQAGTQGAAQPSAQTEQNAPPADASSQDGGSVNADGFVFEYKGEKVYMDEGMAGVLAKLGEPDSVLENRSCVFDDDGFECIYRYPGIQIHTYPRGGTDYVYTVDFKDDSLTTPEGLYLGSSMEDMVAAYGEDYEEKTGQYIFSKGQTTLEFMVADNEIYSIVYKLIM
ncbi:MAG: hypothetical protein LBR83_00445, partial [Clostridiales bacterium]|nr:hypothetical protein [Clostridiales bacterium]